MGLPPAPTPDRNVGWPTWGTDLTNPDSGLMEAILAEVPTEILDTNYAMICQESGGAGYFSFLFVELVEDEWYIKYDFYWTVKVS